MHKKLNFIILLIAVISGVSVSAQESESDISELIHKYDSLGYNFLNEGRFDSAEYYYLKTIDLKNFKFGPYAPETAYTHINIASIYKDKLDYETALLHLGIAEKIFKDSTPNSIYLAYVYHNKGNIFTIFDDYAEGLNYFKYALDLLERIDEVDSREFQLISITYFHSLLAMEMLDRADSLINSMASFNFDYDVQYKKHYSLSVAYENLGMFDKAEAEITKMIEAYNLKDYSFKDELRINSRLGIYYQSQNDLAKTRDYFGKNIALIQNREESFPRRQIFYYYMLADTYLQEGKYQVSYERINDAINSIVAEIESQESRSEKYMDIVKNQFIYLYILKARAAIGVYGITNNQEYLEIANQSYLTTIEQFNLQRLNMKNEESVIFSTQDKITTFQDAINLSILLYTLTGENSYLEQAFRYTENSKSFALLSEIKKVEAMKFSDLPQEVKNEEERYNREIAAFEDLLYREQTSILPDSARITNFEYELFNLKDDYNTLLNEIENNYSNYYSLKYNPHFETIKEIRKKVHRKEALVEYVLADTLLTTFIIDQNQVQVLQQTIDPSFAEECIAYYRLLNSQEFDRDVHKTYREYVHMSRMFYKILIEPVREITDKKQITFVPDGELMYLPFESFLTADVDPEYLDYKSLPYMIHEISVAYAYSSTLLFSERLRTKSPDKKVLAFAPEYESLMGNDKNQLIWNRQANPEMLMPLLGAKEEVNNISKRVKSTVFRDKEASEHTFKDTAENYSILHLAMHTILNDEEPMFSRLAFTRDQNDTLEDNDLFTYEIYNMKLNAEMVVLSSCSSGFGKMQRGEGMMSLARGFMYAGCPSIVMTLWQVSDRSSSELMSSFYKYLKRGNSKKEALRLSKIDYIKSADKLKSNPYFWTGFVLVGDSTPLYRQSAAFYWGAIIVIFVGLVIFFQYRKQLRKVIKP